ncbi:MAG: phosphoglycerate dehydrogenase, partial [Coriobacteriales bacterium]|nr:phosphoglycerate dehydrogenase [Coriobacteriales bacterium]
MRVLVCEKISVEGLNLLEDDGYDVDVKMDMPADELIATVPGYDALIVRSATKITREVIEADPELKIIGRAGMGVDNIDLEAATEHGVIVCNAPTSNIVSAAEHTMALLLALVRNVPQANTSMHEGRWQRGDFIGTELYDKTLA